MLQDQLGTEPEVGRDEHQERIATHVRDGYSLIVTNQTISYSRFAKYQTKIENIIRETTSFLLQPLFRH